MSEMAASAAASFVATSLAAIVPGAWSWRNEAFGAQPSSVNSADMQPELKAPQMADLPASVSSAASRNLKTAIAAPSHETSHGRRSRNMVNERLSRGLRLRLDEPAGWRRCRSRRACARARSSRTLARLSRAPCLRTSIGGGSLNTQAQRVAPPGGGVFGPVRGNASPRRVVRRRRPRAGKKLATGLASFRALIDRLKITDPVAVDAQRIACLPPEELEAFCARAESGETFTHAKGSAFLFHLISSSPRFLRRRRPGAAGR